LSRTTTAYYRFTAYRLLTFAFGYVPFSRTFNAFCRTRFARFVSVFSYLPATRVVRCLLAAWTYSFCTPWFAAAAHTPADVALGDTAFHYAQALFMVFDLIQRVDAHRERGLPHCPFVFCALPLRTHLRGSYLPATRPSLLYLVAELPACCRAFYVYTGVLRLLRTFEPFSRYRTVCLTFCVCT